MRTSLLSIQRCNLEASSCMWVSVRLLIYFELAVDGSLVPIIANDASSRCIIAALWVHCILDASFANAIGDAKRTISIPYIFY